MIDLLAFMRSKGYEPGDAAILDGAVHRFPRAGKKDNAWLIGWRNHSMKTGEPYEVALFGDWRTREEHTYAPTGSLSKDDKAAMDRQIAEVQKKATEAKSARQIEAADKADKRWRGAGDDFGSPYCERKKIPQAYGTKTINGEGGRAVVVPMRDIDGRLWGLQTIQPNGEKRFIYGQKVDGTFHAIGEPGERILLCEGFATGATLHQATGVCVIVAFNAGNLCAVAKALRKKYPDALITVCCDDDKFLPPDQGNPGREKGEKAAVLCQGVAVFPDFKDLQGKLTDFNDLHVEASLDAVRATFERPRAPDSGFIPLGFGPSCEFYYSIKAKAVLEVNGYTEVQMGRLALSDYWSEHFPSKLGVNWRAAKEHLIDASQRIGPFNPARIRGTGLWSDKGRVVLNTGGGLVVDGVPMALPAIKSWHVYIQTINRMADVHPVPLTASECQRLVSCCTLLNWKDPKASVYLAGWLAIARIAGALPVRPHIWLTGGAGTGKSTIMGRLVSTALGHRDGRKYVQGGTTEAGLRQEMASSSIPAVFDEFETTDGNRDKMAALVELLRQTWSATEGAVVKGTVHGHAQQYQLGFAALVSSIRIALDTDADRSRFTVLELAPHGGTGDKWPELQAALAGIDEEYGERLFARMVRMARVVMTSQKAIERALAVTMGQRFAQQHSTLLAGFMALQQDEAVDADQAAALVKDLDLREERADMVPDERECLEHLLTWKVSLRDALGNTIDQTIGEAVASNDSNIRHAIKRLGVAIENDAIFVAYRHAELDKIFVRTRWKDWGHSLKRLPNAAAAVQKWFGDGNARAVRIPRTSL